MDAQYQVQGQRPTTALDQVGNPTDAVEITFTFGEGYTGKVIVPVKGASQEAIRAKIVEYIKIFGNLNPNAPSY